MTSYCSFVFLALYLPAVILSYQLMPKKVRPYLLLVASYALFWLMSGKLIAYLLFTTVSVYKAGQILGKQTEQKNAEVKAADRADKKALRLAWQKKQRRVLAAAILLQLAILLTVKYGAFFVENVNAVAALLGTTSLLHVPHFVMPIGISFYTLQAVSYLTDVYRGTIPAEQKLAEFALYMSFFPGIMEGPIVRYGDMKPQLFCGNPICYQGLTSGLQRILYGLIKKVVIADRLNPLVQQLYDSGMAYDGGMMLVAMLAFTCQEYMEFSGTMDVIIGTAEIFNIRLAENFTRPFFSKSISEFWRRWHITLGTWFKDYIFYPVSMAKPMKELTKKARKTMGNYYGPLLAGTVALFCVWSMNGLWHGAGWNYIGFGMFHFLLIVLGNYSEPVAAGFLGKCHINREKGLYAGFRMIRTAFLVCMGEMIFRAATLSQGLSMLGTMFGSFSLVSFRDGTLFSLGLDRHDFMILAVTLPGVLVVSILQEKGIAIRKALAEFPAPLRWAILYGAILYLVIFGAYGNGYLPIDPIYAGF